MHCLKRLYRALRYARITANPRLLALLSHYRDITLGTVAINADGSLALFGSAVGVESQDRHFLLEGVALADDLRRCSGASFEVDDKNRVLLTAHGVRLVLTCWEELFIAHEVFYRSIYNLSLQRPFHVLDVGMNTGTSALFFASIPYCERVVGYELFEPTLRRARENIALNPAFGGKIEAHACGLGPKDERLVLDYFPEYKGSVGREGLPEYARPLNLEPTRQREVVQVRAAVPVVEGLLVDVADRDFVCKIDCEGAEYDIITCLADADLIRRVSVFLIEWHSRGPQSIKSVLMEAGFNCLSLDEDSPNHGMIYAFKRTH
jgi:FkbM family methyltransferase